MFLKKNIKPGKIKGITIIFFLISIIFTNYTFASNKLEGKYVEIKVLDKVSSKNTTLNIKINNETQFKNLIIKAIKCVNSEFDDSPEITAYLQVKDIKEEQKNKVFVFNGWTFSSNPSINPFDHPVYDIWLTKCYN